MCHLCGKNKGADQLRIYLAADLQLFFANAKSRFSDDAAHMIKPQALEILPYTNINTRYKSGGKHIEHILYAYVECSYIVFIYDRKVEFQAPVIKLATVPVHSKQAVHKLLY